MMPKWSHLIPDGDGRSRKLEQYYLEIIDNTEYIVYAECKEPVRSSENPTLNNLISSISVFLASWDATIILDSILVAKFYHPKGMRNHKGIKQLYTPPV